MNSKIKKRRANGILCYTLSDSNGNVLSNNFDMQLIEVNRKGRESRFFHYLFRSI